MLPNTQQRVASHLAKTIRRELGGCAFQICELLRFPIDYVTQAVLDVPTEPRIARVWLSGTYFSGWENG